MFKRSNEKRITDGSRTLKFLREQAKLSLRTASKVTGVGEGVISHLENGRIDIHVRHLEKLLPAYKSTPQIFEMFASGQVILPLGLVTSWKSLMRWLSEVLVFVTGEN